MSITVLKTPAYTIHAANFNANNPIPDNFPWASTGTDRHGAIATFRKAVTTVPGMQVLLATIWRPGSGGVGDVGEYISRAVSTLIGRGCTTPNYRRQMEPK